MAAWCADNLRDLDGWSSAGLPLSTPSNDSARLLDGAIRQMVSWRDCDALGGIVKTFHDLKAADPDSAMATAFLTCMDAMGTGKSVQSNEAFKQAVDHVDSMASCSKYNERERKHLKAAALWARGKMPEAESTWEEILAEHPNDLIAIKFAHDSYFFTGNAQGKRDSVGRVLPKWKKDEPCRSYLHGMYAFGLEECFQYDEAEKNALIALSHRKEDCWATHARAHVLEMQGRTKESKAFMEGTMEDWEPGYMLAAHNFWHYCLTFIEDGEYEKPLSLFDAEVGRRAIASGGMLDLVDAASLLWRLELEGVDVGDRWQQLPSLSAHVDDHFLSFNDAHFAFVLRRAGLAETEKQMHGSLRNFVTSGPSCNNREVARIVGVPLYEGMIAYADGDYEKTVEKIMPVRKEIHRIGGSHAQNDVFVQSLIHACINTGKTEHREYARTVLEERGSRKTHSGIAERLAKKLAEDANHL